MYKIEFSNIGVALRSATMTVHEDSWIQVILLAQLICQHLSGRNDIALLPTGDEVYEFNAGKSYVGYVKITELE